MRGSVSETLLSPWTGRPCANLVGAKAFPPMFRFVLPVKYGFGR